MAAVAYAIRETEYVVDFIMEHVSSPRVYERIVASRDLVGEYPDMGAPYDPVYPAARPPFPCRRLYVPDTPFAFCYLKDDDTETVTFLYAEFASSDPRRRFAELGL